MTRDSFLDCNGKRGKIGDVVMLCEMGKVYGNKLTVAQIINKGRGGTRLYFQNGQYCQTKGVQIVEEKKPTENLPTEINGWQIYRNSITHKIVASHPCGSNPEMLEFETDESFEKWYEAEKELME